MIGSRFGGSKPQRLRSWFSARDVIRDLELGLEIPLLGAHYATKSSHILDHDPQPRKYWMQKCRPMMLVVLDGWGWRKELSDNAIRQAHTPTFDRLWATCPHSLLAASGEDVGLPKGQMGNSEVGHLTIGAGRVIKQSLLRIGDAIAEGEIERMPALRGLIERLRQTKKRCHLMGLISPGGVHSHQDHAVALARILTTSGVSVVVHAFTDGRDTPPRAAKADVGRFLAALPESVSIGTVCGRYYAMDRDNRWQRVEKAYRVMVQADGPRFPDVLAVITDAHQKDIWDEFIMPAVVGDYGGARDGDTILCFNFRADRVRQILTALLDPAFVAFARPARRSFRLCSRHDRLWVPAQCIHADDLSIPEPAERAGPSGG